MTDASREDSERTSLLIQVPDAEPIVAEHRQRLDHTSRWGIPAHLTVLSPFIPFERITQGALAALRRATSCVEPFSCTFSSTSWFGDQVLWLAPDDDRPFRALTSAVLHAFPDHPPYRGAFSDPTPHLTIGDTHLARPEALGAAAAEIRP